MKDGCSLLAQGLKIFTFRAVSKGPETLREQHQTIENDIKIIEIINIVEMDSDGSK